MVQHEGLRKSRKATAMALRDVMERVALPVSSFDTY